MKWKALRVIGPLADAARYAATHRLGWTAAVIVFAALGSYFVRGVELVIPSTHVSHLFISFIPLLLAGVVTNALSTPMDDWEATAGRRQTSAAVCTVLALTLLSTLCLLGYGLVVTNMAAALVSVRALAIWLGTALIGGRALGWRLSWVLPLLTLLPLTFWSADSLGRVRWWDWVREPADSTPLLITAVASVAVGMWFCWLTRWRMRRIRTAWMSFQLGTRRHR